MPYVRRKPKRAPRKKRATTTKTTTTKMVSYRKPRYAIRNSLPFPKVKNVCLVYKNTSNNITSSTGLVTQRLRLNSLFDADYDNFIGNKGPLYKDQLLGANGPYQYYKVNAWKTYIKVINVSTALQGQSDCPLYVFYDQGAVGSYTEADTDLEMQNRPGVIVRTITQPLGASPMCTIKSYKTLKSFVPVTNKGTEYAANYNVDPATKIYSTLLVRRVDNSTTAFSVALQVTHKFYVTLYQQDAINSV